MSFTKADLLIYPKEKTAGHIRTYYPQYIYIYTTSWSIRRTREPFTTNSAQAMVLKPSNIPLSKKSQNQNGQINEWML